MKSCEAQAQWGTSTKYSRIGGSRNIAKEGRLYELEDQGAAVGFCFLAMSGATLIIKSHQLDCSNMC